MQGFIDTLLCDGKRFREYGDIGQFCRHAIQMLAVIQPQRDTEAVLRKNTSFSKSPQRQIIKPSEFTGQAATDCRHCKIAGFPVRDIGPHRFDFCEAFVAEQQDGFFWRDPGSGGMQDFTVSATDPQLQCATENLRGPHGLRHCHLHNLWNHRATSRCNPRLHLLHSFSLVIRRDPRDTAFRHCRWV